MKISRRNFLAGASALAAVTIVKANTPKPPIPTDDYVMTEWESEWARKGWMVPRGQTLLRSEYAALFRVLGTAYGSNGPMTFKLPVLDESLGRVPAGTFAVRALMRIEHGDVMSPLGTIRQVIAK